MQLMLRRFDEDALQLSCSAAELCGSSSQQRQKSSSRLRCELKTEPERCWLAFACSNCTCSASVAASFELASVLQDASFDISQGYSRARNPVRDSLVKLGDDGVVWTVPTTCL